MTEQKTSKKITVGLMLSWIFGILFTWTGIISVFSEPIPGIVMLIMAAVILPPVNKLVDEKWKFHLSGGMKVVVIIIGFIIFGSTVDTSKQQSNQPPVQLEQSVSNTEKKKDEINPTEEQSKTKIIPVEYEIVKSEDQSRKALGNKSFSDYTVQEISNLPMNKRMWYRIIVSPKIKENEVRTTIEKIISDITQKDDDIDEIILFLYSDKELSDGPYDIGKATWAPKGKLGNITPEIAKSNNRSSYETTIQIKENLEEYLSQRGKSEDKFGLTEEERRKFFKEIVAAEDRANSEAEKLYPIDSNNPAFWDGNTFLQDKFKANMNKNMDKADELMEKYRAEVRIKYNLTEEQSSEITIEAFQEGWPLE